MLDALVVLRDARVIHCDLKPENVLVKNCESGARSCTTGRWLGAGPVAVLGVGRGRR